MKPNIDFIYRLSSNSISLQVKILNSFQMLSFNNIDMQESAPTFWTFYMVTFPLDNVVIYHYHTDDECYRWPHDQRVDVWLCYNWWWIASVTILSTFTTRMLLRSCHWILLPSILYWLIALIPYHTILQWVNVYVRFNGELFRWQLFL